MEHSPLDPDKSVVITSNKCEMVFYEDGVVVGKLHLGGTLRLVWVSHIALVPYLLVVHKCHICELSNCTR